jgi:hypothetical protein
MSLWRSAALTHFQKPARKVFLFWESAIWTFFSHADMQNVSYFGGLQFRPIFVCQHAKCLFCWRSAVLTHLKCIYFGNQQFGPIFACLHATKGPNLRTANMIPFACQHAYFSVRLWQSPIQLFRRFLAGTLQVCYLYSSEFRIQKGQQNRTAVILLQNAWPTALSTSIHRTAFAQPTSSAENHRQSIAHDGLPVVFSRAMMSIAPTPCLGHGRRDRRHLHIF